MYNDFFGFNEDPFKITPDPDYMYLSSKHEEALELIEFGIKNRKGFLTLVGEVGTGKSTLIRFLVKKLPDLHISLILNPFLSTDELLYSIAKDFGIDISLCLNKGDVYTELTRFLVSSYKNGKNAVVIIDEAQNLPFESFELIRQLSNIELENDKLLQILLSGQPELEKVLLKDELRQLNQRIAIRATLNNFDFEDTENYIIHRINVAAGIRKYIFDRSALKKIYQYSKGNPREINQLCDRALLIAFSEKKKKINEEIIERAANDYYLDIKRKRNQKQIYKYSILVIVIIVFLVFFIIRLNSSITKWDDNVSVSNKSTEVKEGLVSGDTRKENSTIDNFTKDNFINDNFSKDNMSKVHSDNNSILDNHTKDFLIMKESPESEKLCIYVKKNLNLREKPSLNSKVNLLLKKDRKYVIDNYTLVGKWVFLSFNNLKGYIYNEQNLFEIKGCIQNE